MGQIEILHGNADGSFAASSEGGSGSADATTGMGGHLVAIVDVGGRQNFYTATPAGVSVLQGTGQFELCAGRGFITPGRGGRVLRWRTSMAME